MSGPQHPARGNDELRQPELGLRLVSSHVAPRAGSDAHPAGDAVLRRVVSIHTPRAGSDAPRRDLIPEIAGFQSTLPVRGATGSVSREYNSQVVSSHAPRAGSDGSQAK